MGKWGKRGFVDFGRETPETESARAEWERAQARFAELFKHGRVSFQSAPGWTVGVDLGSGSASKAAAFRRRPDGGFSFEGEIDLGADGEPGTFSNMPNAQSLSPESVQRMYEEMARHAHAGSERGRTGESNAAHAERQARAEQQHRFALHHDEMRGVRRVETSAHASGVGANGKPVIDVHPGKDQHDCGINGCRVPFPHRHSTHDV